MSQDIDTSPSTYVYWGQPTIHEKRQAGKEKPDMRLVSVGGLEGGGFVVCLYRRRDGKFGAYLRETAWWWSVAHDTYENRRRVFSEVLAPSVALLWDSLEDAQNALAQEIGRVPANEPERQELRKQMELERRAKAEAEAEKEALHRAGLAQLQAQQDAARTHVDNGGTGFDVGMWVFGVVGSYIIGLLMIGILVAVVDAFAVWVFPKTWEYGGELYAPGGEYFRWADHLPLDFLTSNPLFWVLAPFVVFPGVFLVIEKIRK